MKLFEPETLIRKNILSLKPYSSARSEYGSMEAVMLDANENSFADGYNRYPDPFQTMLKAEVSKLKCLPAENIFLGNGSDEAIDLLLRATCRPASADNIIICPPTYGMYEVSAAINDIQVRRVQLTSAFQLDVDRIFEQTDTGTRIIFICSPNNPTGNLISRDDIEAVLQSFGGIVVLDEAYVDFAPGASFLPDLLQYPNLVVLQTFSKAWGMAGLRLGLAFADIQLIGILNKIKPPYNISGIAQQAAFDALAKAPRIQVWIEACLEQRALLGDELARLPFVRQVFGSDANFLLVRFTDAQAVYVYLLTQNIVVRSRSAIQLCENCLRITIGTASENKQLIQALKNFTQ